MIFLEALFARYSLELNEKLGISFFDLQDSIVKFTESIDSSDALKKVVKNFRNTIGDQDIISRIGFRKAPVSMTLASQTTAIQKDTTVEVGKGISETGGPVYQARDLNSVSMKPSEKYEYHLMSDNDPQRNLAASILNDYNQERPLLYLFGDSDNDRRINEYLKVLIYRLIRGDSIFNAEKIAYDHLKIFGFISHHTKQLMYLYPLKEEYDEIKNEKYDQYYKRIFECLVKIIFVFSNENLGTNFDIGSYDKLKAPPSKMIADGWVPSDPSKVNKLPVMIGLGAFAVAGILLAKK